ncbi:nitroreductase family protein [Bacteroides sp. 519]|uniref:nitroreductase family protein n=1 Tax=Bacteroides sp. 519 TaxID=2302937 RepID=UPI0013D717A7|nr:nitroreductase family protein [Bacteroides sp. 519]NDV58436.1 nitroreductase [Bacteroides sp. 519]
MNFLELVKERKSVRKYLSHEIEQEKIEYIMECTRHAPSAVNRQPWKFLLIKDKEKQALLKQCYQAQWFNVSDCPYYLVILGDTSQSWKRRFDGKDHCDIDISIAMEHFCLAATEQQLGTCWVCAFDVDLFRKLFDLPENLYPVVMTPLGYPDKENGERTPRKDLSEVVEVV